MLDRSLEMLVTLALRNSFLPVTCLCAATYWMFNWSSVSRQVSLISSGFLPTFAGTLTFLLLAAFRILECAIVFLVGEKEEAAPFLVDAYIYKLPFDLMDSSCLCLGAPPQYVRQASDA